jgi:hypothetical protein
MSTFPSQVTAITNSNLQSLFPTSLRHPACGITPSLPQKCRLFRRITIREANVSHGEANSWQAWEAHYLISSCVREALKRLSVHSFFGMPWSSTHHSPLKTQNSRFDARRNSLQSSFSRSQVLVFTIFTPKKFLHALRVLRGERSSNKK